MYAAVAATLQISNLVIVLALASSHSLAGSPLVVVLYVVYAILMCCIHPLCLFASMEWILMLAPWVPVTRLYVRFIASFTAHLLGSICTLTAYVSATELVYWFAASAYFISLGLDFWSVLNEYAVVSESAKRMIEAVNTAASKGTDQFGENIPLNSPRARRHETDGDAHGENEAALNEIYVVEDIAEGEDHESEDVVDIGSGAQDGPQFVSPQSVAITYEHAASPDSDHH